MISFASDYIAGAHPDVLARLVQTNTESLSGYGTDPYCASAAEKIKEACRAPEAEVFFVTGGTQTNQLVIDTVLEAYEGVICADTGHIHAHEAGAVEFTGHKILALPGRLGKISAEQVKACLQAFYENESHNHMAFPGMVYLSYPTEYGTLYSKAELLAMREVCDAYGLRLFADGARLGYGLASPESDLTLPELAALCDVFYIGGTKIGALCGEAVVFPRHNAPAHFDTQIKQHGAMLAKGRLLGVQFDALFTDGLYERISRSVMDKANLLRAAFREKGYPFFLDSPTNQQFIILSDEKIAELRRSFVFEIWERYDASHSVARFVCGWSTTDEDVAALKKEL